MTNKIKGSIAIKKDDTKTIIFSPHENVQKPFAKIETQRKVFTQIYIYSTKGTIAR